MTDNNIRSRSHREEQESRAAHSRAGTRQDSRAGWGKYKQGVCGPWEATDDPREPARLRTWYLAQGSAVDAEEPFIAYTYYNTHM